jgi:hypothetical protein
MRNSYNILVGIPKRRRKFEDLCTGRKMISEWILRKLGGKAQTGCTQLRIATSGGILCKQLQTLGFHKRKGSLTSCVTISFSKKTLLHGVLANECKKLQQMHRTVKQQIKKIYM